MIVLSSVKVCRADIVASAGPYNWQAKAHCEACLEVNTSTVPREVSYENTAAPDF
jgi:hypothetical protein